MFFKQLKVGNMGNFSYLIGCEDTKECAVIDCGFGVNYILNEINRNNFNLAKVFLTHVHFDHSCGVNEIKRKSGCDIYLNQKSLLKKNKNLRNGYWFLPEKYKIIKNPLNIGNIKGCFIESPGHQEDHLIFIFDKYLFTGDVLFIDGCGRTDLDGSDFFDMQKTLEKIKNLPGDLIVCPGHDYGSVKIRTLKEEKTKNKCLMNKV